jgi:hypothetical protein
MIRQRIIFTREGEENCKKVSILKFAKRLYVVKSH